MSESDCALRADGGSAGLTFCLPLLDSITHSLHCRHPGCQILSWCAHADGGSDRLAGRLPPVWLQRQDALECRQLAHAGPAHRADATQPRPWRLCTDRPDPILARCVPVSSLGKCCYFKFVSGAVVACQSCLNSNNKGVYRPVCSNKTALLLQASRCHRIGRAGHGSRWPPQLPGTSTLVRDTPCLSAGHQVHSSCQTKDCMSNVLQEMHRALPTGSSGCNNLVSLPCIQAPTHSGSGAPTAWRRSMRAPAVLAPAVTTCAPSLSMSRASETACLLACTAEIPS